MSENNLKQLIFLVSTKKVQYFGYKTTAIPTLFS